MSKNVKKEVINISLINKNKTIEDKSKQNTNSNSINKMNNLSNIPKNDKIGNLPKIIPKKENMTNNSTTNTMINKKRERTQSQNKEAEEEINNNIIIKKRMPLNEAKKEMKDFKLLIDNTEREIQKKYGIIFPDLSFEDNLPDDIKNILIDFFLEKPDIKKILNEVNSQK